MICRRCLLRAARSQPIPQSFGRQFNASSSYAADATAVPPSQTTTPSTATEPFRTPVAVDPTSHGLDAPKKKKEHLVVKSTVPAGTVLKGINYVKNKSDPVAMEDSEYPSWLWDILKPKNKDEDGSEVGDLYSKSKSKRQAAKKAAKQAKLNPNALVPKVPLYEQSIDMPAGDGTVEGAIQAEKARHKLTKAMRDKRRATIKEVNFLKTMS